MKIVGFLLVAGLLLLTGTAHAAVITNGQLMVDIRTDNGAIDTVTFGGYDFYNPGSPVSDYGFQNGTNTSTFSFANTNGGISGHTVSSVVPFAGGVLVTGTYNTSGTSIGFTRFYQLVPGVNALQITSTYTNNGAIGISDLRTYDTADPDQGGSSSTFNDVLTISGHQVAQATGRFSPVTTVWGEGLEGFGGSGSNFGLGISDGNELNAFFATPYDPNGALQDIGIGIGFQFSLAQGQTVTTVYTQAYGLDAAQAQSAYLAAASVPEPTSLLSFAGLGLCFGVGAWRKRRK